MDWADAAIKAALTIGGAGLGFLAGLRNTVFRIKYETGKELLHAALDFQSVAGKLDDFVHNNPNNLRLPGEMINDAFAKWEALRKTYVVARGFHPSLPDEVPEQARLRLTALKKEKQRGPWREFLTWIAGEVQAIQRRTHPSRSPFRLIGEALGLRHQQSDR